MNNVATRIDKTEMTAINHIIKTIDQLSNQNVDKSMVTIIDVSEQFGMTDDLFDDDHIVNVGQVRQAFVDLKDQLSV